MYRYGLPLGCLFLILAFVAVGVTLQLPAAAEEFGLGVAALFAYAGVMSIHSFEKSVSPV